ncbi:MAG: dephospho-CoA kinase [Gammaproteobacteria bacterium]|nr:dephospho-CoA kinase [Gammaproteobacteria bacterium]
MPLSIGLTGGIASGKSTVADMFSDLGATVIDTDVIARDVVKPGQPALDEIRKTFGAEVIAADGRLNREKMRSIVFADAGKRKILESILHPRIREEATNQAIAASGPYRIIVVPLLVESPMRSNMDRILVVDCSEESQLTRLLSRDAESTEQAQRMIAAQSSRDERLAIADDIVQNEGDLEATRRQVEVLHSRYLTLAQGQSTAG